jgi:hypothetical protein
MQEEMQSGPCVVCGARDYSLSMGGPSICSACDCGYPPAPAELIRLRSVNTELLEALLEARHELEDYEEAATGAKYNNLKINAAIASALRS